MLIEVFETRGFSLSTDTNAFLVNMHSRKEGIRIVKVDVLDAKQMSKHKDVVECLKKDGLDALPLVKIDGRLLDEERFLSALQKCV